MKNTPYMLLAVALTLLGCSCQSSPQTEPAVLVEPVVEAPPAPVFRAIYDGEPLPYKTMVAYTYGGQGLRLVLSSATPVCDDFRELGRSLAPNEQTMSIVVAPKVDEAGSSSWQIRVVTFADRAFTEAGKVVVLSSDSDGEVRVQFNLEKDFEANEFLKRKAGHLSLSGELVAKGCGVIPKDRDAKASPQADLKATFGGQAVSFEGASLSGSKLRLSTQPHSCIPDNVGSDLFMLMELDSERKNVVRLRASGDLIDNDDITFKEGEFPITIEEGEGGTKTVALNTEMKLGAKLTLNGKISPEICR